MSDLESALEALHGFGPEFAGGLANHGPMAAEALDALGRPEAALPFSERYRRQLEGPIPSKERIPREGWERALGDMSRFADWSAFFGEELSAAPWHGVVSAWAARFAPGFISAAAHGVIRTAHAARALEKADTPLRRSELAEGLAYWASTYRTLPEAPGPSGRLLPSRALSQVEPLPERLRNTGGLITAGLDALGDFPPFAGVAGLVDTSVEPGAVLSDLTRTAAHIYLENGEESGRVITFIHTVTGPAAVRLLLPHVDAPARARLVRYAWQGVAALYAAFGKKPPKAPRDVPKTTWAELTDRAIASGDDHAIKFVEAGRREDALAPTPAFLAAAHHAVGWLGRR